MKRTKRHRKTLGLCKSPEQSGAEVGQVNNNLQPREQLHFILQDPTETQKQQKIHLAKMPPLCSAVPCPPPTTRSHIQFCLQGWKKPEPVCSEEKWGSAGWALLSSCSSTPGGGCCQGGCPAGCDHWRLGRAHLLGLESKGGGNVPAHGQEGKRYFRKPQLCTA